MIIRGKEIDMTQTEGSYFSKGEDIIGLIHETKGRKLQKDVLITTNDNKDKRISNTFCNDVDIIARIKISLTINKIMFFFKSIKSLLKRPQ